MPKFATSEMHRLHFLIGELLQFHWSYIYWIVEYNAITQFIDISYFQSRP